LEHFSRDFLVLARNDPRWKNDPRFAVATDSPAAGKLLAELVFELHAFERQKEVETKTVRVHPKQWPVGIKPDPSESWPADRIDARWADSKWLQLYRHDIIENTICADLIDYIGRDSLNSGMQHSMDFKFLEQL